MFCSSLVAFSLFSAIWASPVARNTGSISIKLSVDSPTVSSVEEIRLTTVVTNDSEDEIKFFKYGSVLDELPTQSFYVTTKDGTEVPFTGIRLSVDVEDAPEEAYVVLSPGESQSVTHDVGQWYDFESAGIGSFVFTAETNFVVVDSGTTEPENTNGTSSLVLADVKTEAVSVEVEITESVKSPVEKRATFTCANAAKADVIRTSYGEAKALAQYAYQWIPGNTNHALYRAYWKTNALATVRQSFLNIWGEGLAARQIGCVDTANACAAGVRAYTYNAYPNNMVFCPHFFDIRVPVRSLCTGIPVDARRVGGGIMIHELSHAVMGTRDHAYGCPNDQALAANLQIANADNYHCFTASLYRTFLC